MKPFLSAERTWKGHWWVPEKSDAKMPGVLTYKPSEGLTLDLIGGFEDSVIDEIRPGAYSVRDESRTWPILHGVAKNQQVTLLNCLPTHTMRLMLGPPKEQSINALTALVGVHLEEPDQQMFTECHVSVEDLTHWASTCALRGTIACEDEKLKATLSLTEAEPSSVVVHGTTITLANHYQPDCSPTVLRGGRVGKVSHTAFVKFQPDQPCSLDTAREKAKALNDLISLATHRACAMLCLRLRVPSENQEYPDGDPVHARYVDVYSKHTVAGDPTAKAIQHHDALFTCNELPFEEVMPRWLEVRRDCETASNMVLGLRYITSGYIESQLLTAVGAAEAMHRALKIDQYSIPETDFRALRTELLEHTPDVHKEWVKRSLRNDPNLKDRLLSLAELPDSEAMSQLVPDAEQWAKVATRARNDFAHEGKTPKQSMEEVIAVVKVTSAVVVMNLLQILGVPGERQREIITDHPELKLVANDARDYLTSGN